MNIYYAIFLYFILYSCTYEKVEYNSNNNQIIENDSIRELKKADGYVVGFDPCTISHNYYDIGYAIISTNFEDTLMTYNFPDRIFNFPEEYFANYMETGYFQKSARYEFTVHITYYVANEDERANLICSLDFNQSEFNNAIQIVIKTVHKID